MKLPKAIFFIFLIFFFLLGCKPKLKLDIQHKNNTVLNTLLVLETGDNIVELSDFVDNPDKIDSVTASSIFVNHLFINSKHQLSVSVAKAVEPFVDLKIWINGVPYSIPCKRTDELDFLYVFHPGGKKYKRVQIAGQMNDWTPNQTPDLKLNTQRNYEITLNLSPGTYVYQLVLDGFQTHDPHNPKKIDNGYGEFNSILEVPGFDDKLPKLHSTNSNRNCCYLTVENQVEKVYVYWQNILLPDNFVDFRNGMVKIKIPAEANALGRTYLRAWATNKYGISNDVLIPLQDGNVVSSSTQLQRSDKYTQIIYFLMLDRFYNGNKQNDHPLKRSDVNEKVDYFGGDLSGVTKVIKNGYFQKLGVNTLWISPINQNPLAPYGFYAPAKTKFSGYHGYWPISSSKIDFRFGTDKDLDSLVNSAHSRNMNILLDYVAHHVHIEHPFYKQHPQWATSLYLPDGSLNTERWDDHRLTTWFDVFLPTIDLSNSEVADIMVDSAFYWIKRFNLDGFRHDACKHVPLTFWRKLTMKIKRSGGSFYQIGETYGSNKLINSYLTSGMLDGQFNFNVYDLANTTFAGVGGSNLIQLNNVLQATLKMYGAHNLMGNISGNHDKPRFMACASGDLKFGEDSKLAGWSRVIGIKDSSAYNKLLLMNIFNLTIPGIPVIFYGDEIGITGGNDPDCRKMMYFDRLNSRESKLFDSVSRAVHLRSSNLALIYGDFENIFVSNSTWVYSRKYFNKEVLVFINNTPSLSKIQIKLPASINSSTFASLFGCRIRLKNSVCSVDLPAYSTEVFYN